MPIRPELKPLYPVDWRELSRKVRFARARGKCQRCHLIHDRAYHAAPILSEAEIAAAIARSVHQRLGRLQAEFAARYHVPIGTLRDWEQNRKRRRGGPGLPAGDRPGAGYGRPRVRRRTMILVEPPMGAGHRTPEERSA